MKRCIPILTVVGVALAACSSGDDSPAPAESTPGSDAGADTPSSQVEAGVDSAIDDLADTQPDTSEGSAFDAAGQLAAYLTGRFDSEAQAESHASYWPIQLEMCAISAPELGTRVLYVEQARMDQLDNPYRQRVYVVEALDPPALRAVSKVFELVAPAAAVHLCDDPALLTLTVSDVIARDGCGVEMEWKGDHFEGGTVGQACESTLNGASYATSEVTLGATTLESWDQGFDDQGQQVWGATAGPYIFDRKTPLPNP